MKERNLPKNFIGRFFWPSLQLENVRNATSSSNKNEGFEIPNTNLPSMMNSLQWMAE